MSVDDELKAILGERGWLQAAADQEPFVTEWRDRYRGLASLIALPATVKQVSEVVACCARNDIGIVPQGGNTGLCGGAIPDKSATQIVLSTRRLNGVRDISTDNASITVDAGCTLQQVQIAADKAGLFFPLSLSAEGSCQIGGNLSTNAGGINVLRYGTARAQVLGLEVVLPDGRIVDGLRSLRKDTAGYDLKQLFIGSEGTLGVITGACLRLEAKPPHLSTAMLALQTSQQAVEALGALKAIIGSDVQAFEMMPEIAIQFVTRHIPDVRPPFVDGYPWYVLTECAVDADTLGNALAAMLEASSISNASIAKSGIESAAMWKIRHSISESQKPEGASLKHDISVPVGKVSEFLQRAPKMLESIVPGARPVAFGHVGDGNVHFNISQPVGQAPERFLANREAVAEVVFRLVQELNGSFSAEHGVGLARRDYLARYRSEEELALMRTLKSAIDPQGIMNPGKVL